MCRCPALSVQCAHRQQPGIVGRVVGLCSTSMHQPRPAPDGNPATPPPHTHTHIHTHTPGTKTLSNNAFTEHVARTTQQVCVTTPHTHTHTSHPATPCLPCVGSLPCLRSARINSSQGLLAEVLGYAANTPPPTTTTHPLHIHTKHQHPPHPNTQPPLSLPPHSCPFWCVQVPCPAYAALASTAARDCWQKCWHVQQHS